jgi:predicted RNA binding protein YcfA (HicA-like mRNA interferase family)
LSAVADYAARVVHAVREAIRLVEDDGWRLVVQRGSHRRFKHPRKPGRVTIAGKPRDDLPPALWRSILSQAGLRWETVGD